MTQQYPFSAVVGQERLKSTLLVNAVDPTIGGVLIRGEKGTGKTIIVRSLPSILPTLTVVADCPYNCPPDDPALMHEGCRRRLEEGEELPSKEIATPLVEVPLNATEDRLAGTLHVEHALETGERRFEPGLLARANRGILYVDEVNLLEDHLVDVILDAAVSGVNIVEREGISYRHPSRFVLVGTMNPEEGEVRPQLLDRFGLCVTVSGLADPAQRMEVVRRWTDFEQDPVRFRAEWADEEEALAGRIAEGRERLGRIELPRQSVRLAVAIAARAGVQGHRPDIVIVKTARSLAALLGLRRLSAEVVFEAARLVLPHRMRNALLRPASETAEEIERILRGAAEETDSEAPGVAEGPAGGEAARTDRDGATVDEEEIENMQVPGSTAAGSILLSLFDAEKKKTAVSPPTHSSSGER
ncbi:MAG: ATP-binding protein [Spirochaetota bacterium]